MNYLIRFGLMVALMAGMFATLGIAGWVAAQALHAFGFIGLMVVLFLFSCAIAAAMPDDLPPR